MVFHEAEKAVINPLSVIRGDLSPESFVEAYVLSELFEALPRLAFRHQYSVIDSNPFDNTKKEWNVFSSLADWRPVLLKSIGNFEYEMRLCETRELTFNMHAIATYTGVFYNTMCFRSDCTLCEGCEGYPYEIDRQSETKGFSVWNNKEKYTEYEKQKQCYSPTKICSIMLGCENKEEDNSIRCNW